jgi:hypothetical protein
MILRDGTPNRRMDCPATHRSLTSSCAGETQPEVAQASRDDEAGPAHPHRYSPATDNDWPTHVNPQEMEKRHQYENHAGHRIECSLTHGPILQGFHHSISRLLNVRLVAIHARPLERW